ncbi:MAG TPA: 16S rRNA (guanine(966)-N(2))-methyltransferase RsmD [Alphaproteobacteria bacterium]|nr:16S rRNA (guanine(966)-N(2))-methyltransferase RsmD [Alphaproteobacteria bacterium]
MRIIAGEFRGRILEPLFKEPGQRSDLHKTLRPTSDKVRGAMFNILEHGSWPHYPFHEKARVLDGFCGSGALGFEALSRGASFALFLDDNAAALKLAKTNAENLRAEKSCLFELRDLAQPQRWKEAKFDLVFLDPPYRKNLAIPALKTLEEGGFIAPKAIAVIETAEDEELAAPFGWQLHTRRSWSDTAASFLTRE